MLASFSALLLLMLFTVVEIDNIWLVEVLMQVYDALWNLMLLQARAGTYVSENSTWRLF